MKLNAGMATKPIANAGPPKIGANDATANVNTKGPKTATIVAMIAATYAFKVSISISFFALQILSRNLLANI